MAQRGSRGIAIIILDLGARRGWVASTTPGPLYPQERIMHGTNIKLNYNALYLWRHY
jgi:hypothetical protein